MFQELRSLLQSKINYLCYKYFLINVKRPVFLYDQLRLEGYYSQSGQDKWIIEELFPGKEKGTFVDVGAHDGITFSNTYLLEKMGWNGIAVEPIPSIYKKLAENRKCITINGCVAPNSGKERFRVLTGHPQMLSGLVDEYDPRHLNRIKNELDVHGGEYTDIEVDCFNFNELLEKNNISYIDYLSIDVEGVEYKLLNSIDFDRIHISVIGIENNYIDSRIPQFLIRKGFKFHSRVGVDEFYQNRHLGQ